MKEVTLYQCGGCGKCYEQYDQCKSCESFHVQASSVQQYKYYPEGVGVESRYPYAVVVKMADGKELTFKR